MREFQIINDNELIKYKHLFNKSDIVIPTRETQKSCGYDFTSPHDVLIKPNSVGLIYTGIKVLLEDDEFLMMVIRSSKGRKENLLLANQVGIIDADYYGNDNNDGHIIIAIRNLSSEDKKICKGERIAQGIFMNFLKTTSEKEISKVRKGGFGSTDN